MYISRRQFIREAGEKEAKRANGLNFDYVQSKLLSSGQDYSKPSILKFLEENKRELPLSDDELLRIKNLNLGEKERKRVNEIEAFFLIVGVVTSSSSNTEDISKIDLINWYLNEKKYNPGSISGYFETQSLQNVESIKNNFIKLFENINKEKEEFNLAFDKKKEGRYKSNKVIYDFGDGWKIFYLPAAGEMEEYPGIPNSSYDRVLEGDKMGVCTGSKGFLLEGHLHKLYNQTNDDGKVYSIRGPDNEPKVMIRILENKLMEAKGKFNLVPDLESTRHIIDFLKNSSQDQSSEFYRIDYEDNFDFKELPPLKKEDALSLMQNDELKFYTNDVAACWYKQGVKEIDENIQSKIINKDFVCLYLADRYPDLVWPVAEFWIEELKNSFSDLSNEDLQFPYEIYRYSSPPQEIYLLHNFNNLNIFKLYRKKPELIRLVSKLPVYFILEYGLNKISEFGRVNIDSDIKNLALHNPIYFLKNIIFFEEAKAYIIMAENMAIKYYAFEFLEILMDRGSENFFSTVKKIVDTDPKYFIDSYSNFDWANRNIGGQSLLEYAEAIIADPDSNEDYNPQGEYFPEPSTEESDEEPPSEDDEEPPTEEDYQDQTDIYNDILPTNEDDFEDDAEDEIISKKINTLARVLRDFSLNKEAAYLAQFQHPDWKDEWEQEEETSESILNNIFTQKGLEKKLRREYIGVDTKEISDLMQSKGIKILSISPGENIGKGSFGTVYDGIFKGKEVAVKLQVHHKSDISDYAQDVKNIKRIENEMERFPEFVKRFFPKIYLTEEGKTEDYQYQIIVLEKLYPLAREVKKALMGVNEKSRLHTILPIMLNELNSILNLAGIRPVTEKQLEKLLDVESWGGKIKNIKEFFKETINNESNKNIPKPKKDVLFANIDYIIQKNFKQIFVSFPRWIDQRYDGDYISTNDIENLWNAINWLRKNGIPAGDMYEENIMNDKQGNLKIADLGAFYE